jgi:hypothetical protein
LLGDNQSVSKMEAYDNTRFTIRVGSKTHLLHYYFVWYRLSIL